MAKRESGPSTFFSHCANDAGATTHVAQKCPACDVQVLIHTACLRAFCFCVMIGTNALESFNGSIAALVTKKSDFYASHVGRAQLAILKRSFPGGYAALVELLRHRLELAPLTDQARIAAARHTNKANHIGAGETVCSEAKLQELNIKKRDRRADSSKTAKANAAALKTASAAQLFFPGKDPGASNASGAVGSAGQSPGEVSCYDASGSKHKRTEKEFTATMEPPRKKKRQGGRCKACFAAGVSDTFLVAWKHERKVLKKCREVQEAWTRERAATPVHAAVAVAADAAQPKRPRGAAGEEAPIGAMVAAHVKKTRRAGKQVKAPNGATAADQGNSLHGSGGLQSEAPGGAAAIAKEDMLRDAVVGSTLSRSGRVRKKKILADM